VGRQVWRLTLATAVAAPEVALSVDYHKADINTVGLGFDVEPRR
jgi:hypothetical protein